MIGSTQAELFPRSELAAGRRDLAARVYWATCASRCRLRTIAGFYQGLFKDGDLRDRSRDCGQCSACDRKDVDDVRFVVGNKVRVKTSKSSKITRRAVADADAIHPGETVIVQGKTASSGTVEATTVIATTSNAQSGSPFLRGGFGGGAPQAGATPAGG